MQKRNTLIIVNIFKEQDNDILKYLCPERNCEVVIVLHNLLDISISLSRKPSSQNSNSNHPLQNRSGLFLNCSSEFRS